MIKNVDEARKDMSNNKVVAFKRPNGVHVETTEAKVASEPDQYLLWMELTEEQIRFKQALKTLYNKFHAT